MLLVSSSEALKEPIDWVGENGNRFNKFKTELKRIKCVYYLFLEVQVRLRGFKSSKVFK